MSEIQEQYVTNEDGQPMVMLAVGDYRRMRERLAQLDAVVTALEAETRRVAALLETVRPTTWMLAESRLLKMAEQAQPLDGELAAEELALAEMGLGEWAAGLDDDLLAETDHAR